MKKMNVLLGSVLCLGVMSGLTVPVDAATDVFIRIESTSLNDNIGYVEDANGDGIPDEGENEYNVTVPSVLPIVFNSDGTNTLPTNWTIRNHSELAGISLVRMDLNANGSGWKLLPSSADTKTLVADSKEIQFYAGKENELKLINPTDSNGTQGSTTWENGEITIASGGSQTIAFDINRGAFTEDEAAATAFEMVLLFEFIQ